MIYDYVMQGLDLHAEKHSAQFPTTTYACRCNGFRPLGDFR
jgi:hypothetical protein